MKRFLILVAVLGLSLGEARAQLALPGAEPTEAPLAPSDAKPVHKHRLHAPPPARLAADPAALTGKSLRLNGLEGVLQLAKGDGDALKIVKYVLPGEIISHPEQKCRVDIVSETPIEAVSKGQPDGLPRYAADIPACPLTFDIVDGAVLAPAQGNACVFSAADCQASPSGLWGPAAAELDPKTVSKARTAADRSIQDSQRVLENRDQDAAASLAREQSDFAAERDDVCQGYDGERRLFFCASRLTQTRAALLAKRVTEAGPAAAEAGHKRRKKKAP
jgi:hypothetical protein